MDGSNQKKETYMDKLNPAIREGIRRSFAELDVRALDFEEKAINMIQQLLEVQFKGIIKEWKRDNTLRDKQERINRTEVFNKIVEELLAEFEATIMKANELVKDNMDISSIKEHFSIEHATQVGILIEQIDEDIYIDYLKYRMECEKRRTDKEKEDKMDNEINEETLRVEDDEERIDVTEKEEITDEELDNHALFQRAKLQEIVERGYQAETPDEFIKRCKELDKFYKQEMTSDENRKKEMEISLQVISGAEAMQILGRFSRIGTKIYQKTMGKENLTEEDEELIEAMYKYRDEVSKCLEERFPGQEINLPTLENEEPEIKPSFRQIQNIIERGRQAETPRGFTKISTELARPYIRIRGNVEQKNEMERLLETFPEGINMLKVGLFQINTRKKYMKLTEKENPSKVEQQMIKNMKDKTRAQVERILQNRFPGQNINVSPLRTEKEYIAELKDLESKNLSENRNDQDIIIQMTQMYSELSQVISELKQDKIQKIYNRIIRSLKGRPGIDNAKLPPTLKEFVVQKVETPLPNYHNMFTHDEGKQQKQGDDVGEGGPSIE